MAGVEQTNADGNVAIHVAALTANAVFRLKIPGAPPSAAVRTSSSRLSLPSSIPARRTLETRSWSARSTRTAGTSWYFRSSPPKGSWIYLRSKRLNAAGQTMFILSGTRLKNREVRVVLLATVRHAASVLQNPILVPAPS